MSHADALASARYWLSTLTVDPSNARMVRRRLCEAQANPGDIGTTEETLRRFERSAELLDLAFEAGTLVDPESVPVFPANPDDHPTGPDTDSIRTERERRLDLRKDLERLGAVPGEFLARLVPRPSKAAATLQTAFAF